MVLALGRRCIQLPHVLLPEEAIDLKGRGEPFPALLILLKALPLIPGGAVTQKRSMRARRHVSSSMGLELLCGLPQLGSRIGGNVLVWLSAL